MKGIENSGSISVGNDLNIDQTVIAQSNLLINCDTAELLSERQFRLENLEGEIKAKRLRILKVVGFCILFILGLGSYFLLQGKPDLSQAIVTLGGLGLAYLAYHADQSQSEFEAQERHALKEIWLILKARRAI
jgi:hypothetical protein